MKNAILAVAMGFAAVCTGCDNKPAPKANENKPLEINAPGVEVKVDPQRGVDVKAPGVDVETK
jgi:hypothetical protein